MYFLHPYLCQRSLIIGTKIINGSTVKMIPSSYKRTWDVGCEKNINFILLKHYSKSEKPKMVDAVRVVSFEDVKRFINEPDKILIDVRNPDEINRTGKIPSSINIPLNNVHESLTSMSDDQFEQQYNIKKPKSTDELVFYCHSGTRSSEALNQALSLGYSKSKTYLGSWSDWSTKTK